MSRHPLPVRSFAPPGCFVVVMLMEGWLGAAAAAAEPPAPSQSVVVEAASSHVDYRTDTATFEDIVVSQGRTRVTADRGQATGLDFKSSTWVFEGNVIILVQPQARLLSDRATVEIRNDVLARATATGKPATFEAQRTGSRPPVHGQANEVVYEAGPDAVRLSGDAWLSGGQNDRITGPLLVYGIRDESLMAVSPGGGRGVHITVTQPPRRRRRANGRSGDHHRNLPMSSSHSPDAGRRGAALPAGDRA